MNMKMTLDERRELKDRVLASLYKPHRFSEIYEDITYGVWANLRGDARIKVERGLNNTLQALRMAGTIEYVKGKWVLS